MMKMTLNPQPSPNYMISPFPEQRSHQTDRQTASTKQERDIVFCKL